MAKYKQIVIGIDQSYQRTGISLVIDGKLRDIKSIALDKCKDNSERRGVLRTKLQHLISSVADKTDEIVCICERTRIHGGPTSFINVDAIKSMGALTAIIVDVCSNYGIKVYSVDTRAWKAQVVGTSKPAPNKFGVPEEKWPTVRWVIEQGFEDKILIPITNPRKRKGVFERGGQRYTYNNDAADSAGIAMYYIVGDHEKLEAER